VGNKIRLRSYPIRDQSPSSITIIEAVLATCATQPAFNPVTFGLRHKRREYIGPGLGANNPIREVITEAYSLFGGESTVSSLISLGTGHPGILSFPPDGDGDPYGLMREMINDCEQRAQEMERQIGRVGVYFRFSVEQGMQNNHPDRAEDPSWISAQTESYLAERGTSDRVDAFVRSFDAETGRISLDQLGTHLSSLWPTSFLSCYRARWWNSRVCSVRSYPGESGGCDGYVHTPIYRVLL